MCSHWEQQQLICALLNRFDYLPAKRLSKHLNKMVAQIIKVWALPEDRTQIVAMTHDHRADSAQLILQALKPLLVRDGWGNAKLVNRCDKAREFIKDRPIVVLVDEFAGTGETVCGRLQTIRRSCADKKVLSFEIKVCLVACMEEGKNRIERQGVEVYAPLVQKKGISDHYIGNELDQARDNMLQLESLLMQIVKGKSLPSFGYGEAEALYGAELGNVPNNVFPLFWWPLLRDGRQRNALFMRSDA